jgi:hypothetical protein
VPLDLNQVDEDWRSNGSESTVERVKIIENEDMEVKVNAQEVALLSGSEEPKVKDLKIQDLQEQYYS